MEQKIIKVLLADTDETVLYLHSGGGFNARPENIKWDNKENIHTVIRDKKKMEKLIQALQAEDGYFVLATFGQNTTRLWCILRSLQINLEKVIVLGFNEGSLPVLQSLDINYKYIPEVNSVRYHPYPSFKEQCGLADNLEDTNIDACNVWNNTGRLLKINECLTILEKMLPTEKISFLKDKISSKESILNEFSTGKNWHAIIALMLLEAKGFLVSDIVLLEDSSRNIEAFAKLPEMLKALNFNTIPRLSAVNVNDYEAPYLKHLCEKLGISFSLIEAVHPTQENKASATNSFRFKPQSDSPVFGNSPKRIKLSEESDSDEAEEVLQTADSATRPK